MKDWNTDTRLIILLAFILAIGGAVLGWYIGV